MKQKKSMDVISKLGGKNEKRYNAVFRSLVEKKEEKDPSKIFI